MSTASSGILGKVSSVYGRALLVQGSETLLSDRAVDSRVKAARREAPEAELVELVGREVDAGRFVEATGGSLFSEATIVIVDSIADLDKDLFDLVATTAAHPSEDLCLILVHPGGVKGKGLLTKLSKAKIETVKADSPKPWAIPEFIATEARRAHLDMDHDAADALHQALGNDLRTLAAAIDQLASDSPDGRIDAQAVTTYFGGRAEISAFSVADASLEGRLPDALETLRWGLSTGVQPAAVTAAMALGLRSLGLFLDMRSSRMGDKQLAQAIGVSPWKLKALNKQGRSWSKAGVARAIRLVNSCDGAVKGAAVDANYALESMLIDVEKARQE
ncbi:DNA polymerase III subunit delta [Cutibacterium equinum]|uniref:DNA-directed DNA polymerase n=1 Tax=Cutibacterium equinum TaxID=3016342 RepID=A0ABY7R243_9ACTN|nr:DNA polymerase III subunit delta [Cutibacterium equinum]WCC81050.1 DNA polymerase III subunit delta [Cutibacterium equinum]